MRRAAPCRICRRCLQPPPRWQPPHLLPLRLNHAIAIYCLGSVPNYFCHPPFTSGHPPRRRLGGVPEYHCRPTLRAMPSCRLHWIRARTGWHGPKSGIAMTCRRPISRFHGPRPPLRPESQSRQGNPGWPLAGRAGFKVSWIQLGARGLIGRRGQARGGPKAPLPWPLRHGPSTEAGTKPPGRGLARLTRAPARAAFDSIRVMESKSLPQVAT
jgi:hypothetical protein